MSQRWHCKVAGFTVAAMVAAILMGGVCLPANADPTDGSSESTPVLTEPGDANSGSTEPDMSAVPEDQRDETLGSGWQDSDDIAWMLSGDSAALHVFVSRMSEGYQWREIAALRVVGLETDRWIGNACLTSDERWLAIVFAPRSFTNDETLFTRGGFAAVVDVTTGEVTHLTGGYSLSYFNPGCGVGDRVALSQFSNQDATRIVEFSASAPSDTNVVEVADQVTSVVPTSAGLVGALGQSVVRVEADGQVSTMVEADGVVFDLAVTTDGVAYLQHDGEQAQAMIVPDIHPDAAGEPVEVASGALDKIGLTRDTTGTVYVTGNPDTVSEQLPADVQVLDGVAPRSAVSSQGELALESPDTVASPLGAANPDATSVSVEQDTSTPPTTQPGTAVDADSTPGVVSVTGVVNGTGATVDFQVQPDTAIGMATPVGTSGVVGNLPMVATASPISAGVCAIPRNDPSLQAYQPRPAEVEWAVDQAVQGSLNTSFPLQSLLGGGSVPPQVMLGVLAQESNFWQASRYTVPGVYGDPLIANYYGVDNSTADGWWQIDYANADCGYGIAQVTDEMRSGDMDYTLQRLIALDYKANIARGLQILIDKWNQTRAAGMVINDGNPAYIENWFYALWAYNSGFHAPNSSDPGQPWGVGWANNPINPLYPANRAPFLDRTPADAAHPQDWPYPERVLGFAAYSVELLDSVDQGPLGDTFNYVPAFQPAWWAATDQVGGILNRQNVKPPIDTFCDATNQCSPAVPADPCSRSDEQCWYHVPATWKEDCAGDCGHGLVMYDPGDPKPDWANSYPSNCSTTGLPAGALIVDNLPNGAPSVRPGCTTVPSSGTFQFNFPGSDPEAAKIDLHQLGSGFNGQFYFSHIRVDGTAESYNHALDISGTWTLDRSLSGWAGVYVHMPSHGAWLQQASYTIQTGLKSVTRSVNQQNYANTWVSLGTLQFQGVPTITLANNTAKYSKDPSDLANALSGVEDIAWDAVAFVPLKQKPTDFIVALGDSYSSGEGTSALDGSDFFRGSDHGGAKTPNVDGIYAADPDRNACHRSLNAWPYGIYPPGIPGGGTARSLLAAQDPRLDFQLLACSGATTNNVLPSSSKGYKQQYGELTQLDRGFLDENTTLVTLTIGGNDAGFADLVRTCIGHDLSMLPSKALQNVESSCENATIDDPDGLPVTLGQWATKRLDSLVADGPITEVLQQVHLRAPNARVLLLGYPKLFESAGSCVFVFDSSRTWLNGLSDRLNSVLTKAAYDAGTYVTYQDPQYLFSGRTLCTVNNEINGVITTLTPGDSPLDALSLLGPDFPYGISNQSIHPNQAGALTYSVVAKHTLLRARIDVAGTLVGGAPTVYYGTFRWHSGGPASLNVSSFNTCGTEIRLGLRKNDASGSGVVGEQDTDTLSWTSAHAMQTFTWMTTTPNTWDLPQGYYALNGRLTTACKGGGEQPWEGQLYFLPANY